MRNVLLIDDDAAIHLIASAALQRAGAFKIGFARNGHKGLERARATHPDLILLDSMMPDIDGEEVIEELRRDKQLRDTPVIFITAKGKETGFDYEALGAQGLVTKPFDPDQLASEICSVLNISVAEAGTGHGGPVRPAFPAGGSVEELRRSFVRRGVQEVEMLLGSVSRDFDVDAARRLAHLWVGRGGTLGHPDVSVAARRLEMRLAQGWSPDRRWRLQSDLQDVHKAFQEAVREEDRRSRLAERDPDKANIASKETRRSARPDGRSIPVIELDADDLTPELSSLPSHLPELELLRQPAGTADNGKVAVSNTKSHAPAAPAVPDEVAEILQGRVVSACGFDQCDVKAMQEAFTTVGGSIRVAGLDLPIDSHAQLPEVDIAIVNVEHDDPNLPWRQVDGFLAAGFPCIAVGSGSQLLASATRGGRCEFLLSPWCAEEVLLRCFQLLSADPPDVVQTPSHSGGEPSIGSDESRIDVVIADDDPTITALVDMTLRDSGFRCHIAIDGEDALRLVREIRPRAAVLDVNMPQMDGFEVLAALRNDPENRSMAVVMLTALRQEADVVRGFRLGADDYVVKPFNPMELSARLDRLVRGRPR